VSSFWPTFHSNFRTLLPGLFISPTFLSLLYLSFLLLFSLNHSHFPPLLHTLSNFAYLRTSSITFNPFPLIRLISILLTNHAVVVSSSSRGSLVFERFPRP
jgi:hypothetical protein